ncbi:MAG: hypothetical protein WC868_08145 [Bacteroidales bacterium]
MIARHKFWIIIIFLTIIATDLIGQPHKPRDITFLVVKNSDTLKLLDKTVVEFCYSTDTLRLPLIDQTFTLDTIINLKFSTLRLISDSLTLTLLMVNPGETFESVLRYGLPSSLLFEIKYYTDFDIADKNYLKKMTVDRNKFKLLIVWTCDYYCCENFNFE